MDAPYCDVAIGKAAIDTPLLAQSPLYQPAQPPIERDAGHVEAFVSRLQPAIGLSGGTYALGTAFDAGAPVDAPDTALPGLRDGAYEYSARLKNVGDQGIVDNLLRDGGSYLEVKQAPYLSDDRPAGR
jgi:hypothetical protein